MQEYSFREVDMQKWTLLAVSIGPSPWCGAFPLLIHPSSVHCTDLCSVLGPSPRRCTVRIRCCPKPDSKPAFTRFGDVLAHVPDAHAMSMAPDASLCVGVYSADGSLATPLHFP